MRVKRPASPVAISCWFSASRSCSLLARLLLANFLQGSTPASEGEGRRGSTVRLSVGMSACKHHLLMCYSRTEQWCNDMLALKGLPGTRGVSAALCYNNRHYLNPRIHCLVLAFAVMTSHFASHCGIIECISAPHALCTGTPTFWHS